MKRFSLISMFLLAIGTAGSVLGQEPTIINDKNAELREVSDFHGIEISGAIELYFTQGSETKVAISARDVEDIDKIETEVRGGILYIHFKDKENWWKNQWNTSGRRFRAYVSCPEIKSLVSSGSGNIHIDGKIKSDELSITLSGSGNVEGEIVAQRLEIEQSGSSNVRVRGNVDKASFNMTGSGNVYGSEMITNYCDVSISGSGNVEVTSNKEISAQVSGSGNVRYRGTASIQSISTAGSGKIKKLD